jgi:hypothetical protein
MLRSKNIVSWCSLVFFSAVLLAGCSSANKSAPSSTADWKKGLDEDVVTALSQLSPDDRSAALSQKVCPVSDKPLGGMGKPFQVTVEGEKVFLCCGGCQDTIRADSKKYLSKLKSK